MEEAVQKNKIKRLITGWIISIIALTCLLMGGIPLLLFLLVIVYFGADEYVKILQNKGFHPSLSLIYIANILFALLIFFHRFDLLPSVVTWCIIASFLVVLFKGRQPYIGNVATSVLGFMYGGWLPCHILLIRQFGSNNVGAFKFNTNEGLWLIILIFLIVLVTDIGAYYFGSRHGKHPLAPIISPKKTVEGSIGGLFCAILISLTGALYTNLTVLQCLILGFLVTMSAQLGDLSESLIKRDAGVKDSSDILPGHGGFLDRVDSYIFALPVAYYYIAYFTHGTNVFIEFFQYLKGFLHVYF